MNNLPVSVIIVSFNTKELTRKALKALYSANRLPDEVIVVDNNSEDGSIEMIRAEFPEVILYESKKNSGFAQANNYAINRLAKHPYVWLLNSDTETGKDSLEQLFDYLKEHHHVGAVVPNLVYPDKSLQSVGGYFPTVANVFLYLFPITYFFSKVIRMKLKTISLYPQPIPEKGIKLDYVTGAAMLLRKRALAKAGLLGEEYFMYFEETDLCWRLHEFGWDAVAVNTDPVMHVYGGSFKTKYDSKRLKLFLESLKKFVRKNYKGIKKNLILLEISFFGNLSIALKGFRKGFRK